MTRGVGYGLMTQYDLAWLGRKVQSWWTACLCPNSTHKKTKKHTKPQYLEGMRRKMGIVWCVCCEVKRLCWRCSWGDCVWEAGEDAWKKSWCAHLHKKMPSTWGTYERDQEIEYSYACAPCGRPEGCADLTRTVGDSCCGEGWEKEGSECGIRGPSSERYWPQVHNTNTQGFKEGRNQ